MLRDLRIRNYRVLKELHIPELARINLFIGKNNSGKTSLLEAIFLWSGAGNPSLVMNPNVMRWNPQILSHNPEPLVRMHWRTLFNSLDISKDIDIHGHLDSEGLLQLKITSQPPDILKLPFEISFDTTDDLKALKQLIFSFKRDDGSTATTSLQLLPDNLRVDHSSEVEIVLKSHFLSTHSGVDAEKFSEVGRQKQDGYILEALQAIDPRIQGVQVGMAGGVALIWVDVGLDEYIPLATVGEGMNRLAGILVAMADSRGGMVLVDEVESGIHHSVLEDVWRAIDHASKLFDVQVFATSHSFECLADAQQSVFPDDDLRIHRLEAENGKSRCVTYDPEGVGWALEHNYEVR